MNGHQLTPAQVKRLLAAVEADVELSDIQTRFHVGLTTIQRLVAAAKKEKKECASS